MLSFIKKIKKSTNQGFILPLTLFVCMIMLSISTSISVLLAKEIYFSRLTRLSQVAYYAADDGLMCATSIEDKFVDPDTGLGIFQYDGVTTSQDVLTKINTERTKKGLTALTLNDIKCATAPVFDQPVSGITLTSKTFSVGGANQNGVSTTFNMKMDLGGGEYRCSTVTVNKTSSFRQIIARGFASCGAAYNFTIERAIVSNTVSSFYAPVNGSGQTAFVLTSGNSWIVPSGVASIKVWAIGGGGGGAGTPVNNSVAGGGGAAGGTPYKTYVVAPGQVVTYSLGSAGAAGSGASNGGAGGQTVVSVPGYLSLTANGGQGGLYDNSGTATGGSGSGGDGFGVGGSADGATGNSGGGGGAGINMAASTAGNCKGTDGSQANDINGLFSVVAAAGYTTTGPGAAGATNCSAPIVDNENGTNATGLGSGGGGAGRSGGNGGNGLYGGGGGGASGGNIIHTGGSGGMGVVVISTQ